MRRNLTQAPHRDVVQGALAFEPGKDTLYSRPLPKKCLPGDGVLPNAAPQHQFGVCSVDLNDRLRPVLPLYQAEQCLCCLVGDP